MDYNKFINKKIYEVKVRAIKTSNFMIAEIIEVPYENLKKIAERITKEIPNVARMYYEITGKPPATIEYI